MRKIKSNLDGVRKMSQLPGALIVIDARKEYIALREARKLGIPTIAILDTDSDPDTVDIAIPANDDSIRAVDILLSELADAVAVGKTITPAEQPQTHRPKRARSSRGALARAQEPEPAAVTAPAPPAQQENEQTPEPAEEMANSQAGGEQA
jgi:small subunit ribosomal protein S2